MTFTSRVLAISIAATLSASYLAADDNGKDSKNGKEAEDSTPTGRGIGTRFYKPNPGASKARVIQPGNGINYHGGPIMLGITNVYLIWYGNWTGNSATTILPAFAQSVGGSPYFNINTTYYNGSSVHVSNAVSYAGTISDNYSRGANLADADIKAIVTTAIAKGLPLDANGVYFVLTSQDVSETSGFCTQYCGWHTAGTINNVAVKYSFVGNAAKCPSACAAQTSVSPNGNVGADAMVSILAHELEEAVTDPLGNAWYDTRGQENADKCAWTFGTTFTTANGSQANMVLGGKNYLIQQNWVNAGSGGCALAF